MESIFVNVFVKGRKGPLWATLKSMDDITEQNGFCVFPSLRGMTFMVGRNNILRIEVTTNKHQLSDDLDFQSDEVDYHAELSA